MQVFPTPPSPSTKLFPDCRATLPRQEGKTVAITGCTSGTGRVLARTCGELGARVVMLNRPSSRADAALSELVDAGHDAVLIPCDLQSLASVRAAAERLQAEVPEGLDVLCNNAGVMALPDRATSDGFDVQVQTNHLSHFLLTSQVWSLLERAAEQRGEARVVNHSSGARRGITLEDRYFEANGGNLGGDGFPGFAKWRRYQQTKLANLLFTYGLSNRVRSDRPAFAGRIKSLCAHPGPTDTGLQGKTAQSGGTRLLDQYVLWRTLRVAQSTEDGTLGILRASCAAEVEDGDFYGPAGARQGGPAVTLPPERDPEAEDRLWAVSLRSLGLASFFPTP